MALVKDADIEKFVSLRREILEAFEDACPHLNGRSWKMHTDDRRDMFWRLADNDESLVYGEDASDVTDEIGEMTFIDVVVWKAIWRPEGEDFVVMAANTGLGDHDVVVFLSSKMERHLSAAAEKRGEEQLSNG